jgi:hypothetical protein
LIEEPRHHHLIHEQVNLLADEASGVVEHLEFFVLLGLFGAWLRFEFLAELEERWQLLQ